MRGSSHLEPKVGSTARCSVPPSALCAMVCRVALRIRPSAAASSCWYKAPAVVSSIRLPSRLNSSTSSWASSACTWRLTALWVKASSSAALVKLPCRAAASKASNKDMEGVSLLVFIHKTHGKTASFTFALKHDTPENHDNR
ncbi:hypothetical protein ALP26_103955 [Pseudomonas savastanoi pv. glycinea]|uniref:Uncharacterized protein n=1 Tax=Pseudomonas savastanoi pv. glycinea TaxID=318 RepID=A0A3M3UX22_PSESG|nr:hypothetical protein ALQ42_103100 [Pseudomonas savastanoi pv. glycinea]RMR31771.1 hypothetical protein ALP88_103879 [Pseudomonas savastanoi pv. glycinea]RMU58424.1 hypothetical protein ALP26_103955 [Pseudomonas savastanoi pv. glycinea]